MSRFSWVAVLLLIFLVSAAVTWLARAYALRRNLMDQPGERRSHQIATPRGGGIAIVFSMLWVLVGAGFVWPGATLFIGVFSAGLILVAGIGWWDDHQPLSAGKRLAVHAVAALLLASLVWIASANVLHALLAFLVTISLINIWNFMDGINGLAVTQAALVAVAFAMILPSPFGWGALTLVVACGGFLPYNFPRARIFLGDVGSGALGYLVAGLLCLASISVKTNWLVLLLPLTVFSVDAGITLLTRILTRQQWMQPHTQHLYQELVKSGASHTVVTLGYAASTVFGITLVLIICDKSAVLAGGTAVAWLLFSSGVWFVVRRHIETK